jgi:hypothetical protein
MVTSTIAYNYSAQQAGQVVTVGGGGAGGGRRDMYQGWQLKALRALKLIVAAHAV